MNGAQLKQGALRVVRFPLVRILLGAGFVGGALALTETVLKAAMLWDPTTSPLGLAASGVLGYWLFVQLVERRRVTELFSRYMAAELAVGLALGALLFTITVSTMYLLGVYSVDGVNTWAATTPILVISIMAGVVEELLIRGIVFRLIEEWLGSWIALGTSALLFGALHAANPHADAISSIAIALEAGVMLAAAYMLTRRLGLAIGIHAAWNYTQSGVFGVATSGYEFTGYLQGRTHGPTLLSGGEFGAEASIVAVIVCTASGGLMLLLAHRRGHFTQPFWRGTKQYSHNKVVNG